MDGLDDYLDELEKFIPNEYLGRNGFRELKIHGQTSLRIYSPYHESLCQRLGQRHLSYARFIYGMEEKLSKLAEDKAVNILDLAAEDRVPKFFAATEDWNKYLRTCNREDQLRDVERVIDVLIVAVRKRREKL